MAAAGLRPLTFGEILDGAFTLYRRNFSTLFAAAFIPFLPIVGAWIGYALIAPADPAAAGALELVVTLLAVPYGVLAYVFVYGLLTHQIGKRYVGEPTEVVESVATTLRRLPALVVANLIMAVLVGFGMLLLIVPGILVFVMLFAIYQAIVLEDRGPIAALGRSRQLAKGAYARIFGIYVMATLIAMLPMAVIGVGGALATATVEAGAIAPGVAPWSAAVQGVATYVVSALVYPFTAGAMVLLYYDRRVRTEALDLELDAELMTSRA